MALDAHARYWKALGETVVAVQWGPWREVGMAATKGTAPWRLSGCTAEC